MINGILLRRRMIGGGKEVPASDGKIWMYYDVDDISSAVKVLNSTTGISAMEVDGTSVSVATTYQFESTGRHLVKYTLSGTVVAVRQFKGCAASDIYLPQTITYINDDAFQNIVDGLIKDLNLPNLTYLHTYAFQYSGGTHPTIKKVSNLGSLTEIQGNNSCRGTFAFQAELTEVVLPDTLKKIGEDAFQDCTALVSMNLPQSITSINNGAFIGCGAWVIDDLNLPNLTYLHTYAFQYNGGTHPTIKKVSNLGSLTEIQGNNSCHGTFAFQAELTEVTIPSTVTSIGAKAFLNCSALKTITCLATTPPTLQSNSFSGVTPDNIYVPSESVDAYKTATRWSDYASVISAIPE